MKGLDKEFLGDKYSFYMVTQLVPARSARTLKRDASRVSKEHGDGK